MRAFLCEAHNVQREALTAVGYGVSFMLAAIFRFWNVGFYVAPFIIVVLAEGVNQYISFKERRQRDRGLRDIETDEDVYFENH